MRFSTVEQWLAWQETLNPRGIELGLERVRTVWQRLCREDRSFLVITVAGTNGKGSCVAMLEAVLRAAGYRTGAYLSPHLLRYNERIRIDGDDVGDAELMAAFEAVDRARGDVPLTYFEFGTLAALVLFQGAPVQVAVLEVGLGGRLDAVNVVDADAVLISSVGVDHVDWLGADRESIGREKAGVLRSGRPAVYAESNPPQSVIEYAAAVDARLYRAGVDFDHAPAPGGWCWTGLGRRRAALPHPVLAGAVQLQNAAGVMAVLELLREQLPVTQDAVRRGLLEARLPGRFQVFGGEVECILDVAHNPEGARVLAAGLRARPCTGRTLAVLGMLADKDVHGVAVALDGVVDDWYAAGLDVPRGLAAAALVEYLGRAGVRAPASAWPSVEAALRAAREQARAGDRVIVLGSFHTVAQGLHQCV